jgi:putative oxidoreductase
MRRLIKAKGRVLMSGIFVAAGWDAFRHPVAKVPRVETLGLPEAETLVKVNGLTMVAAGTALALGITPRLAALALVGTLIPTTVAGHPFWDEDDPAARARQRIQFLKNVGLLGGLLYVVAD